MIKLLKLLPLVLLSACVTAQVTPMKPTSLTLPTKKSDDQLFKDLIRTFSANDFRVKSIEKSAGLITFEPKEYKISRGMLHVLWPARANVQILTGEKQVQVQVTHECAFGTMTALNFIACNSNDSEAMPAIQKQDQEILELVKKGI